MKKDIHPTLHMVTVVCACGNTFETRSTKEEVRLEICSDCHPFFSGKQKLIDTAGRVERFKRRYAKTPRKIRRSGHDRGPACDAPMKEPGNRAADRRPGVDRGSADALPGRLRHRRAPARRLLALQRGKVSSSAKR